MSDRGTNEAEQIKLGLAEYDESQWKWGIYVERNDPDGWTPLVYGGFSYEDAYGHWQHHFYMVTNAPDEYRNPRIVRWRAVSPWEVRDHE